MSIRILLACGGALGALFISPWVAFAAALLLSLRYPAWEVLCIGLLVDLMWLPASPGGAHIPIATLIAIALVWVLDPVRKELLLMIG